MARKKSSSNKTSMRRGAQQLRIIGGDWRSRRIQFADAPGLRPTMDKVRETVFNWLQWDIEGKVILDGFAGSGALGYEALSRGAKEVTFLEFNASAANCIRESLQSLEASNAIVHQTVWQSKGKPQLSQHCTHFYIILTPNPRILKTNLGAECNLVVHDHRNPKVSHGAMIMSSMHYK